MSIEEITPGCCILLFSDIFKIRHGFSQETKNESEKPVIDKVKECLIENPRGISNFKTIECSIMDLADDIAYSTYDVEDAFKTEFLTQYDMLAAGDDIYQQICDKVNKDGLNIRAEEYRSALMDLFYDIWNMPIQRQLKVDSENQRDFETLTLQNFLTSYNLSRKLAQDGYYRTQPTSRIVNMFIMEYRLQ